MKREACCYNEVETEGVKGKGVWTLSASSVDPPKVGDAQRYSLCDWMAQATILYNSPSTFCPESVGVER